VMLRGRWISRADIRGILDELEHRGTTTPLAQRSRVPVVQRSPVKLSTPPN
jgi:hypothetical protein